MIPPPQQHRRQTMGLQYSVAQTREMAVQRERRRVMNNYLRETSCDVIYIFLITLLVLFNGKRKCSQISYVTIVITLIIKALVFVVLKCTCCGLIYLKIMKIHWVKILNVILIVLFMLWQFWIIIDFFANNNKCRRITQTLWFAELILMIEALFSYCKCGIVITLVVCGISLILFGKQQQNKEKKLRNLDFKKIVASLGQLSIRPDI